MRDPVEELLVAALRAVDKCGATIAAAHLSASLDAYIAWKGNPTDWV